MWLTWVVCLFALPYLLLAGPLSRHPRPLKNHQLAVPITIHPKLRRNYETVVPPYTAPKPRRSVSKPLGGPVKVSNNTDTHPDLLKSIQVSSGLPPPRHPEKNMQLAGSSRQHSKLEAEASNDWRYIPFTTSPQPHRDQERTWYPQSHSQQISRDQDLIVTDISYPLPQSGNDRQNPESRLIVPPLSLNYEKAEFNLTQAGPDRVENVSEPKSLQPKLDAELVRPHPQLRPNRATRSNPGQISRPREKASQSDQLPSFNQEIVVPYSSHSQPFREDQVTVPHSGHRRPRRDHELAESRPPRETEEMGRSQLGVSSVQVDALVGKDVYLPCDIEPDTNQDRLYMVLWFHHLGGKPIYRYGPHMDGLSLQELHDGYDVRGRSFNEALKWSDPEGFDKRADFLAYRRPAALMISNVDLDDEGYYRCRVDFKNSPTRNFQIRLNVIVPPHNMLLYDDNGRDIGGQIGPLEEGSSFHVNCEVRGGRPRPLVRWLFNGEPLNVHQQLRETKNAIISRIALHNANRTWLNSTIRCQAINTLVNTPHERQAKIDMYLRPTSVAITNKPRKVNDNIPLNLECIAKGSRPHAVISWYRNNLPLRNSVSRQTLFENDTTTISRITIVPQHYDDGATYKCRAENVLLNSVAEDSFTVMVEYKPIAGITLGSALVTIKEGEDAYLECIIKSNPREYKILWYRDDKLLNLGQISNIFVSNRSLVLQNVKKTDTGLYSCNVTNSVGWTLSPHLYLRILFKPHCSNEYPAVIGAILDEQIKVRCVVLADPEDLIFSWTFTSNGGENINVSPLRYVTLGGGKISELRYTAFGERDYGTLTCYANNSVGPMSDPCVFKIIPASRPDQPKECTTLKVERRSEPYLAVHCRTGFNGGLRQHFTLELIGETKPQVLVNTTEGVHKVTDIWLNVTWSAFEGMQPHQNLAIIARNSRGAAEPLTLNNQTFLDAYKWPEKVEAKRSTVPLYAVLLALALLLAVAVATAICTYRSHKYATSAISVVVASKRPSQSVVQVDSQGRRCIAAYPTANEQETAPDILNPKSDNPSPAPRSPPRVVLESHDGESYLLRELAPSVNGPFPITCQPAER